MQNDESQIARINVPPSEDGRTIDLAAPNTVEKTVRVEVAASEPDQSDDYPLSSPTLAAQYDIIEKIGDGGMGVVYLGRDRKLGRYVAVKRLHREALLRANLRERFSREAKAIAALSHVNIVHVYSLGEDHHGPYIAMEYVAGPQERSPDKTPPYPYSLADAVHTEGPMTVTRALDFIVKLANAIDYAHGCGVIHRDLKPSNVLLTSDQEPKIVDFGLARQTRDEDQLTVPGERMLSLGYGAPEQETDASVTDERADVYGLGALLYFSITGKNPRYFRENDVPDIIRDALVKALETDRDRRWTSAREFAHALSDVKAPSTIDLPSAKNTWRCKWCDTVNPMQLRYCAACGWDGGEPCAECGTMARVGVSFCGTCGADLREYEQAQHLLTLLKTYRDRKNHGAILQHAQRITSFKPAGPEGEKLVARVHALRTEAEKADKRVAQLRTLIRDEMKSQQYELAQRHIAEHEALCAEPLFEDEKAKLPELLLDLELARARKEIARRHWDDAADRCTRILKQLAPDNTKAQELLHQARRHSRARPIRVVGLTVLSTFALYVLSAAPIERWIGGQYRNDLPSFYRFAAHLHDTTFLRFLLEGNAELWGVATMFNPPPELATPKPAAASPAPPPARSVLTTLQRQREAYHKGLAQASTATAARKAQWPDNYIEALTKLQNSFQKAGDFDGWIAVDQEIDRFSETQTLTEEVMALEPAALRQLQGEHLEMLASYDHERDKMILQKTEKHIQMLQGLKRNLTMKGKIEDAALVHAEIEKVQSSPAVVSARQAVEEKEAEQQAVKEEQFVSETVEALIPEAAAPTPQP